MVWKTDNCTKKADERQKPGHMFEDSFEEHLLALTQAKKEESSKDAPFDSQRNAAASWVDASAGACLDDTMVRIMKGTPNARG